MRLFVQNQDYPSQVLFAFDEVANAQVNTIRWAVAYASLRGCQRLVNRITQRMGASCWENCKKRFVISLDFGLTEPAALRFLATLPDSEVQIAGISAIHNANLYPEHAYHPKVYLFDTQDATGYVIGSANLTESAMISNTEVVTAGHEIPDNGSWDHVWKKLISGTTALNPDLLATYETRWKRPSPRPIEPDPAPPVQTIHATDKPIFWDAVIKGEVTPEKFAHFWVEAGSMSSGGSQNQLELPRGANRFFKFDFLDYDSEHSVIGHPILTIGSQRWDDRKLTWHGNNRMERINLPTISKGGFHYVNTAILFRRYGRSFEIKVVPWTDPEAIAWRTASNTLGRIFRLGKGGGRLCGLF